MYTRHKIYEIVEYENKLVQVTNIIPSATQLKYELNYSIVVGSNDISKVSFTDLVAHTFNPSTDLVDLTDLEVIIESSGTFTLKGITNHTSITRELVDYFTIIPVNYEISDNTNISISGDTLTFAPTSSNDSSITVTATDSEDNEEAITLRLLSVDTPIIIGAFGQSQFQAHTFFGDPVQYPNTFTWDSGTINESASPINPLLTNDGENIALRTVALMNAFDVDNVYLCVHEVYGGTGFIPSANEWETGDARYNAAVASMQAALTAFPSAQVPWFIMAHGGASAGLSAIEFKNALDGFRTDLCTDVGLDPSNVWLANGTIYSISDTERQILQDSLINIWASPAAVDRFVVCDWQTGLTSTDGTHLDNDGKRIGADRMYESLLSTDISTPQLSYLSGVLNMTVPTNTNTDETGSYELYNPTAGRSLSNVELEVTVDGVTTVQTEDAGLAFAAPGDPEENVSVRARLLMTGGSMSDWSNPINYDVPAVVSGLTVVSASLYSSNTSNTNQTVHTEDVTTVPNEPHLIIINSTGGNNVAMDIPTSVTVGSQSATKLGEVSQTSDGAISVWQVTPTEANPTVTVTYSTNEIFVTVGVLQMSTEVTLQGAPVTNTDITSTTETMVGSVPAGSTALSIVYSRGAGTSGVANTTFSSAVASQAWQSNPVGAIVSNVAYAEFENASASETVTITHDGTPSGGVSILLVLSSV